jgi:EamA-like transporter family
MKRKATILGQVRDVEDGLWDVRDLRDTKYGFDLLFGSPVHRLGSYRGGLPRLIATRSLKDFWEVNRTKRDGVIFDLPAGRTTLKRVRRRLGFHSLRDLSKFWKKRIEDLETLSAMEAILYLIVAGSILAFTAYTWLLGRMPATKVASYAYVNPVIALAIGYWLGGETLSFRTAIGTCLVLGSVVLILRTKSSNGGP